MNSKTLESIVRESNLCLSSNPLGTDKYWPKSYIKKYYDLSFIELKSQSINLLEIGFRHGASLYLWSQYFNNANIYGLDNGSDITLVKAGFQGKWLDHHSIEIQIGDAYSDQINYFEQVQYDVIIDDGPHTLSSQVKCLQIYSHRLKDGGRLIIEDILCGGLCIFPFLWATPVNLSCKFYDFRYHRLLPDNCLFVAIKSNNRLEIFSSRVSLLAIGILYILTEGPLRLLLKFKIFF